MLLLEGAESQSILGEMPIRAAELELIPCVAERVSFVARGTEKLSLSQLPRTSQLSSELWSSLHTTSYVSSYSAQ